MHWASVPLCIKLSSRLFSRTDSSPTFRTPEAAAARRGRGRRRLCLSPTPIQSFADRSGFGMRNRATTTAARRRWRLREVGRTWDGRGMEGGRRGLSPSFKCLGRPSLPRPPLPSHLQGSAKRRASGLVNCVPALTYHSCLACSIHVIPPLAEPCGRRSFE